MTTLFDTLGLRPELTQAVSERGYTAPTDIQAQMIPVMLTGVDVIGQAQTGTGKTAAFSLPILHNLIAGQNRPQALILSPTRELAIQVAGAMREYGSRVDVRVTAIYGGSPYGRQISALRRGVDVVVGTPGRLLDLLKRGVLDLSGIRTLVLDEADEMLSMGFIEDIETILQATPEGRQLALFSATMPPAIRRLAGRYLHEPQSVTVQRAQRTVASIEQRYYLVNPHEKLAALTRLFEMEDITRSLIFVRTRAGTDELANALASRGIPAEMLNGDLSQEARERVMRRFREDRIKVLVATDVAARGLDVDDISHVFNYDLPDSPEVFVHRIGRTARAGKDGIAVTLVTPSEQRTLRRIEQYTGQPQTRLPIPTKDAILEKRKQHTIQRMEVWLRRGRYKNEQEMVAALVEAGHDPLEVAAAALRLAREAERQRPIEHISEVRAWNAREARRGKPRPTRYQHRQERFEKRPRPNWNSSRSHEAGMVRLKLDKGRSHGLRPADVVGTLAHHADIPGKSIGAIRIQEKSTLVDVPEHFVERVLAQSGAYRLRSKETILVRRA